MTAQTPGTAGSQNSWMARTFSSLKVRNFRLFFIGQLVSNSGNWLTTVAIGLLVLHRTNSGFAVGLLAACQFGPIFLLSAWAGLIADRINKRKLLYVTQTLEMLESFALAALAFIPGVPLWAFFVTALAGGTMLAFDNPARRSFVNEMVGQDNVTNAVTLYSAMVNLSRIVGPTAAGALIVTLGYGWCFLFDGASYLVVLAALVMMRGSELFKAKAASKGKGQIRSGIRYVLRTPELRTSFTLLLIIGVLSYNFTVVFPLFVEKGLGGGDAQYTLFYACFSVGAVVGTLLVARRESVVQRTIIIGAGLFGVSMCLLGVVPDLAVGYPVAALVGGTSVSYMTATTAIAQLRAEPQMVGRVLGLQTVLMIGTTPIGGPILGAVSDSIGGRSPVIIGGIAAVAVAVVMALAVRRADTRPAREPAGRGAEEAEVLGD